MQEKPLTHENRPPIVAIMGHVDHGKSSLLDYIRKTNIIAGEAGGITQHLGAYEAEHSGKKIIFLDTPGHEAFTGIRERGATVADIALLIVSAVEGVKPQTLEALAKIQKAGKPFIVVANKIDLPSAAPEKVKQELAEKELYVEGYGGTVPFVEISAKKGDGVSDLLDLILLQAELSQLKGDSSHRGVGVVIEASADAKKGNQAVLIVQNGTLKRGQYIVIGSELSPLRMVENFLGKPGTDFGPSSPVRLAGLSAMPKPGTAFAVFDNKKEAERYASEMKELGQKSSKDRTSIVEKSSGELTETLAVLLKADAEGSLEALEREISRQATPGVRIHIIHTGIGPVNENDLKLLGATKNAIVVAFHVKTEKGARDFAETHNIEIKSFDIIYKASEDIAATVKERTPKVRVEQIAGRAKILKIFGVDKGKQIVGGLVTEGVLPANAEVKIERNGHDIADGKITDLEQQRQKAKEVPMGKQFGAKIDAKFDLAEGDYIRAITWKEEAYAGQ